MHDHLLTIQEVSLRDIVSNIKKNTYAIPNFQRDYVWKPVDRKRLGDSLLWCYPISSLLLLPTSFEEDIGKDPLKIKSGLSKEAVAPTHYVLDGQQRLTSIGRIFIPDTEEKESFYFDLLAILSSSVTNQYVPLLATFLQTNGLTISDLITTQAQDAPSTLSSEDEYEESACTLFKSAKKGASPSEHRNNHRYVRCDLILESRYSSIIRKFIEKHLFHKPPSQLSPSLQDDITDELNDYLNGLFGKVANYKVPVTTISENCSLDLICAIFERLNYSGKKLTTFDLVNAKTYDQETKGIAAYLQKNQTPHMTQFWGDNMSLYLRIAHFAETLILKNRLDLTNGLLLKKPKSFWFEFFDTNKKTLATAIEFVVTEGLTEITNSTFLEYAMAVMVANPGVLACAEFRSFLVKYALYLGIHRVNLTKSHLYLMAQMDTYAKDLLSAASPLDRSKAQSAPSYMPVDPITADTLLRSHSREGLSPRRLNAIFHLFYLENGVNVDLLGSPHSYKADYLRDPLLKPKTVNQRHHIIPKKSGSLLTDAQLNSVPNFALLGEQANISVSNSKTEHYLQEWLKVKNPAALSAIEIGLEKNLIPTWFVDKCKAGTAEDSDSLQLLQERATALAAVINKYFGT